MNGIMLQAFQWEDPADGSLWRKIRRQALRWRHLGVTAVWMPPPYKGAAGGMDVGYGVYDLYDLGEFDQKGSVRTKYGTKEEFLEAIRALRRVEIQALPDVVLNHRIGGDEAEELQVYHDDPANRAVETTALFPARVYSRFTFAGRHGKYSARVWDHTCFTGTDWDDSTHQNGLFRFEGKHWAQDVDKERGNFDYLMGNDVDVNSPDVRRDLSDWGHWFTDTTHCDGFRLDAVKHISASFYHDWLPDMRAHTGKELFTVGEYWSSDVGALLDYLTAVDCDMSLFDVPLHDHLHAISRGNGGFDMRHLFDDTLVGCRPQLAVTFVDNHDTQPAQSLESWVDGWFKAAAYALILLRAFGYPCVFAGDLFGIPTKGIGAVTELPRLMYLRKFNAYGEEHDFFDHPDVIGFTREGLVEKPGSGLACLCTDGPGGEKRMYVGKVYAGCTFRCVLGGQKNVTIDGDGCGTFAVRGGGLSVYVPRMRIGDWLDRKLGEAVEHVQELFHKK